MPRSYRCAQTTVLACVELLLVDAYTAALACNVQDNTTLQQHHKQLLRHVCPYYSAV
jgi:hypothetical protein